MIADNIKRVIERVERACATTGRTSGEISIVAASKTQDTNAIRQAYEAGIRIFGENRAQELTTKTNDGAYRDAQVHFIGVIQRNKVKNIVGVVSLIQSVHSYQLIDDISNAAIKNETIQDVLVQINIGNDPAKSGFTPVAAADAIDYAMQKQGVRVAGMMCIPPMSDDSADTARYYEAMHKIYIDNRNKMLHNRNPLILSMGMTGDYIEAIKSGSNMIRVGVAIFGQRPAHNAIA